MKVEIPFSENIQQYFDWLRSEGINFKYEWNQSNVWAVVGFPRRRAITFIFEDEGDMASFILKWI